MVFITTVKALVKTCHLKVSMMAHICRKITARVTLLLKMPELVKQAIKNSNGTNSKRI